MKKWLERKKAALCLLAGICAVSIFIIIDSGEKIIENKGGSYVVKIKHYGIDAEEMERSITIPLEDSLFAIPGVFSAQSSSQNSVSSVFIRFKSGSAFRQRGQYEAIRDAAQRVYETLPSSVQRPEILSSTNSRVPVWSGAVFSDDGNGAHGAAQLLDRIVKPRFERLEGAGEVLVSGVGSKQIFIILDQEKLSSIGLEAAAVAHSLGMNDSVFSGGLISQNDKEIIVTVDGRYDKLDSALIPLGDGKIIGLSDIAIITEQEREPDILSRLNGKKTAGIAIMGRHGADLKKLSSDIKKEIVSMDLPLEFTVLSDLGAEEAAAFKSVLNAALSGAIMVALISFLLNSNTLNGIFCALSIPVICLVSIMILSIGGFSIDRLMLAGIAAGVGTAVDAVILTSEKLRFCKNYTTAAEELKKLAGPLTAGAATTAAALLPLAGIDEGSIKIIAISIACVCITALVISLSLLPPLLMWPTPKFLGTTHSSVTKLRFNKLTKTVSRRLCKFLAADVKFCTRHPAVVLGVSLLLTAAAVFALFSKGVDAASYGSEDSVYAQVEFDGGLLSEEVDRLLAVYSVQLVENEGIKNVETGARTGSGSLLISFDPKLTQAHLVRDLAKQTPIPGGFVFFHENSSRERYWEIKVYGDEDKKCRELAEELAYTVAAHPIVRDRVLNFKQGSKKLVLMPNRDIFANANGSFSDAANKVRSGVYGPVAYKRMSPFQKNKDGEVDVRILSGKLKQTREGTLNLLVSGMHIDSLMSKEEKTEPSSIRRDDRRRTASITITTDPLDPRRVRKELLPVFSKIDLPPGYSIEFDPEAISQAQALSATVLSLILAILFCYMIIASINESFTNPLIVLAAIPPSLSLPALILVLSGSAYNMAIACAFIAVSGMTVNAAVLCVDGLYQRKKTNLDIYLALRKKMPALLATAATTVAGAIPFLFLKEGANTIIRTISLVGALGVTCSCICSITVIPSLFICNKFSKFFRSRLSGA